VSSSGVVKTLRAAVVAIVPRKVRRMMWKRMVGNVCLVYVDCVGIKEQFGCKSPSSSICI